MNRKPARVSGVLSFVCAAMGALGGRAAAQDCGTWALRPETGPPARWNASMAFDSVRRFAVLFGGVNAGVRRGDLWTWDGTTWTLRSAGPTAREGAAMVFDNIDGSMLMFGGQPVNFSYFNDTWRWSGSTLTWTQLTSASNPPARWLHALAHDPVRQRVVLFGGNNGGQLGDTWEWNGVGWNQRIVSGPSPRSTHVMIYDAARAAVVLFGGFDGSVDLGDTWEWNGTTWTLVATTGPTARETAVMVYDNARARTLLYGGKHIGAPLTDTWEWIGGQWRFRASVGASPRSNMTAAYDRWRDRVVLFGGTNGAALADTWELTGDPAVVQHPSDLSVCIGSPINLSVQGSGSPPITYTWRRNGQPIAALPTVAQFSDSGTYDAVVTSFCGSITTRSAVVTISFCQPRLFVDAAAPAGGTGSSWGSPLRDLQDALDIARVSPSVTEIWVKRGSYKPDRGTGDRFLSFRLVDNVAVYGGFAGTETTLAQRNLAGGLSTLNGDLLGDDVPESQVNRSDNTNNLVVVPGGVAATLDGFAVRAGWGISPDHGAGLLSETTQGLVVANCSFTRNDSARGSGIWAVGSPTLRNCSFSDNRCATAGAAIHLTGPGTSRLYNCLFNGNFSDADGGGIFLTAGASAQLVNCTIVGNWVRTGRGGGVCVDNGEATVVGSIVWYNGSDALGTGETAQLFGTSVGFVNHCCVQNWTGILGGAGMRTLDPLLVDPSGPHPFGTWGTILANPRIRANSPCIDSGNTPIGQSGLGPTDLDGNPRFLNDAGSPDIGIGPAPIIDIGAFEFQFTSCYANCDGSLAPPVINVADFICYLNRFAAADLWANCDSSVTPPVLNVADFVCYLNRFGAGCP